MVNGCDHLDDQKLIAVLYFENHVVVLLYLANRRRGPFGRIGLRSHNWIGISHDDDSGDTAVAVGSFRVAVVACSNVSSFASLVR